MSSGGGGIGPGEQGSLEVRCSLNVYSDTVDPQEVTGHVGIDPTEERIKGRPRRGNPCLPVVNHQWIWQPDESVASRLDDQLDAIWEALGPRASAFRDLQGRAFVQLSIWMVHKGSELSLGWVLARRHVTRVAEFGAAIDVDEYDETCALE